MNRGCSRFAALASLNVSSNALKRIDNLDACTQLTYLNLSANRLKDTNGLQALLQLQVHVLS